MRIARISALRLQRFFMPGMIRDARRAYFVNISYFGDKFGEILEVLEITQQKAYIVFMSDHGDMLGVSGACVLNVFL